MVICKAWAFDFECRIISRITGKICEHKGEIMVLSLNSKQPLCSNCEESEEWNTGMEYWNGLIGTK